MSLEPIDGTPVIVNGLYLNNKRQKLYVVHGAGRSSEDQFEGLVTYNGLYPQVDPVPWVRPLLSFQGKTVLNGVETPRFTLLRSDEVVAALTQTAEQRKSRHLTDMSLPGRIADRVTAAIRDNPHLQQAWDAMPEGVKNDMRNRFLFVADEEAAF